MNALIDSKMEDWTRKKVMKGDKKSFAVSKSEMKAERKKTAAENNGVKGDEEQSHGVPRKAKQPVLATVATAAKLRAETMTVETMSSVTVTAAIVTSDI